jgi:hypothetical protein
MHALNRAGRRIYNWHRGGKRKAVDGCRLIEEQGMKVFLVLGWGLMAAAAAIPAAAAPFDFEPDFRPFIQNQPPSPWFGPPQRDAGRPPPPPPQRDMRPPGEPDRGRMSPDERRQLRRDIQDAGRDIYRRDQQAPRRDQQAPRRDQQSPRRSGRR